MTEVLISYSNDNANIGMRITRDGRKVNWNDLSREEKLKMVNSIYESAKFFGSLC